MAATIYRRDYLQRYVLTPTGTATDYSGRLTTTTADYMGRNLQATVYAISTAYTLGQVVAIPSGILLQCTVAGTSAASTPTAPGYGLTVVSGGATFLQITTT
ncbi:MAG TPA: hypothetical protein VIU37_01200 [Candidatus Limnocylindrales bacterium]|jgi:hypothetical protein